MSRIMMVLMVAAIVVAMVAIAGPAMAQDPKAERKAARKAARQAEKAPNPGAQKQQQLPATGGIPAGSVALLGTGVLLVGGGLVVRRAVRR